MLVSTAILALLATQALSCPEEPSAPDHLCGHHTEQCARPNLALAIERVAAASSDPECTKEEILGNLNAGQFCFVMPSTQEELERLIAATHLRPRGESQLVNRFGADDNAWFGQAQLVPPGRSSRAHLTYSFVPDGTIWIEGTGSDLLNQLRGYAPNGDDFGKELVRQALAGWSRSAGLTFSETADSGIPHDRTTTRRSAVGDIRLGANAMLNPGDANVLAANFYPAQGGDMNINSLKFTPGNFYDPTDNFRFFRNVIMHEFGHAFGYAHQTPCDHTKLMEPFITTDFDGLQIDERRGAGKNYGDRYSGNTSAASAHDFGLLTRPSGPHRSIVVKDLSTYGATGPEDWFRFTIAATQTVQVSVTPTGGDYSAGPQTVDCEGFVPSPQMASQAGDLALELRNDAGDTVIASSSSFGPGLLEALTAVNLAPGSYTVRVRDLGPNTYEKVQLYTLRIAPTGSLPAPEAVAGVDKRVAANTACWFMGDINSRSNLGPLAYTWDLNGDGIFESVGPKQFITYPSSAGNVRVSLMAIDAVSGLFDIDTINVSVIGAAPTISSVVPNALRNRTVDLTINGDNFYGLDSLSQISVSGSGVTLGGAPVVNAAGTQVTGVTIAVVPTAALGARNVTITTPSGTFTATGGLTVAAPTPDLFAMYGATCRPGSSVAVTLVGTDFFGLTGVSVSGSGVTVTGTPVVNSTGDRITGLTFNVAAGAPPGVRNISVTTPGGTDVAGLFTVVPNNDACANAIDVSAGGVFTGTLAGASNDFAGTCGTSTISPDVWYRYVAGDCSTFLDVTTCGTNDSPAADAGMDTVLSLHTACTGGAVSDCNDNDSSSFCGSLDSGAIRDARVSAILNPGQATYIRVSRTAASPSGAFTLRVQARTSNSMCSGALTIPAGSTNFDGTCADSGGGKFCTNATTSPSLWFKYFATCNGPVSVRICGVDEALLSLYTGPCNAPQSLACAHIIPLADCPGSSPAFTFNATANTFYYLCYTQFGSIPLSRGTITITPGPANGSCANAVPLYNVATFDTTCSQTTSTATCSGSPTNSAPAVWYTYVASCTGTATVDTCGSALNTYLNVYDGTCSALSPLACNDNQGASCTQPNSSRLTFNTIAGTKYLIRVGGVAGATGTGIISVSCSIPQGACCQGAICTVTPQSACGGAQTAFAGVSTVCNAEGNNSAPCCKADFNHSGTLSVQDIFDFLAAYFSGSTNADINQSGTTSVQDIFDFLAAYFAGCA